MNDIVYIRIMKKSPAKHTKAAPSARQAPAHTPHQPVVPAHTEPVHHRDHTPHMGTLLIFMGSGIITAVIVYGGLRVGQKLLAGTRKSNHATATLVSYSPAAGIDPFKLMQQIDKKDPDVIIVDLRSSEAYAAEHMKTAVSQPFTGANAKAIAESLLQYRGKSIVLYGDTQYSESPRAVAGALGERGVRAVVLETGWTVWRHMINFWVPEQELKSFDIMKYVESGE